MHSCSPAFFTSSPSPPLKRGEWRSWCGAEASSSLGWHFYCDRDERKDEEPQMEQAPKAKSAKESILSTRKALEEARAQGDPGADTGERNGLPAPSAEGLTIRRRVLRRLPARRMGEPGSGLHAETPRRRARQEAMDRGAAGGARRSACQARRTLRPDLHGFGQMSRL